MFCQWRTKGKLPTNFQRWPDIFVPSDGKVSAYQNSALLTLTRLNPLTQKKRVNGSLLNRTIEDRQGTPRDGIGLFKRHAQAMQQDGGGSFGKALPIQSVLMERRALMVLDLEFGRNRREDASDNGDEIHHWIRHFVLAASDQRLDIAHEANAETVRE